MALAPAAVLSDLLASLLQKQGNEKLTYEEGLVFVNWRFQTLRTVYFQSSIAAFLTFFATRKLNKFNRLTLTGGACYLTYKWRFNNCVKSFVDHILGMEGTRMQHELKKIVLENYGNYPERMKLFSKHFYCEEVFNDFAPGRPVLMYRPRNLFFDNCTYDYTSQESFKKGVYLQERNGDLNVKLESSGVGSNQVPMRSGLRAFGYGDPLDVLFGDPHPDESGNLAKAETLSQRKARRKHRAQHRHRHHHCQWRPRSTKVLER